MHILEQYALNCGLKIGKPYIYEKYFPLPCEKYITFNPFGKFNSRKYSYWQEVINILNPILQKHNIKIVQIGGQNEQPYNGCVHLMGATTFNQTAYIINNSLLHFGVDSFPIHIASYFNKKIVALYCNMYSSQSKPYWSDSNDVELIQADLKDKKPSYAPEENPKTIDTIKPEKIVSSILNFLNINENINQETIFAGSRYGTLILESIPSIILPPELFPNILLNIRFDYINTIEEKDYVCTLNNLNIRNCSIITNKSLEIEKLSQLKEKLINLIYDISFNDIDIEFVNMIKSLGIQIIFIFNKSKNSNEFDLNNRKLQLIDHPELINIVNDSIDSKDLIKSSSYYKSNKLLFADNQIYLSKAAYLENKPVNISQNLDVSQSLKEISNIDLLIQEDGDHCLFYK